MPLFVFDGEPQPQFPLVFLKELDIKELLRHHKRLFTAAVKEVERFKVAAIASACLGDMGGVRVVGDEVIHLPAYVDAGFATAVEDEEVVVGRDFLVLKDVVPRSKLLRIHCMVFVGSAPYADGLMPCGRSNGSAVLHHRNMRHIEHSTLSLRKVFKCLSQTAISANAAVLVLSQFCRVNGNKVLRASQFFQQLRCGSDANNQCSVSLRGFADGISGNAGEVGLRAVCWEHHDVVGFVADDDLKAGGKIRVVLHPHTELRVGGYHDFVRDIFDGGKGCAARQGFKEHIGHCQGFILCQAQIAVLRINKEQGFTGGRCQGSNNIDSGGSFAAAARGDDEVEGVGNE